MTLPARPGEILLLHNPRCSKSREAKALLEEALKARLEERPEARSEESAEDRRLVLSTRLYLEQPLSADELRELQSRLGRPMLEWTRTREEAFAAAGLSRTSSEEAVRTAMARAPSLMERPIVVDAGRAVIGRPPTNVLELIGD